MIAEVDATARQADVLGLVMDGLTDRAIASRLGIASPTVRAHLRALFDSIGARDRVSLVLEVVRLALDRPRKESPTRSVVLAGQVNAVKARTLAARVTSV